MSAPAYIPDGQTLTGFVNEAPGLYPKITFTFRRMTAEEFAEYRQAVDRLNEVQAQRLVSAHLAARIVSWDIASSDRNILTVNEDAVRRLPRALANRLWLIVAGVEGADGILGQTKGDDDMEFRAALRAAQTGRSLQEVREEEERKNSPAA